MVCCGVIGCGVVWPVLWCGLCCGVACECGMTWYVVMWYEVVCFDVVVI